MVNPVDGTSISIPGSDGGTLGFTGAAGNGGTNARANQQINFFIDDGIQTTPLTGAKVAHKFTKAGIFITTTEVMDPITKNVSGRMRKTIAISTRELGPTTLVKPEANDLSSVKMNGKFVLNGRLANDLITFSGRFELPAMLDVSKTLDVFVSIANIPDTLTVNKKGIGTVGTAGLVSGLKVKYPAIAKKQPVLPPQQFATISWKVSGSGLSKRGADTDGVDLNTPNARTKTGAPLMIQVLLSFGGETYEKLVPVSFAITNNGDFGNFGPQR